MLLLIDQDGVLADFEQGLRLKWRAAYSDVAPLPPEARRSFRASMDYPEHLRARVGAVCYAPGFFRDLPPVSGAVAAIKALVAAGHDVRICTSPLLQNPYCVAEKYQWVAHHLGPEWPEKMILTKDKTLVQGDYLIDDKPDIMGSLTPVWQQLLYDATYNQTVTHLPRMRWDEPEGWQHLLAPPPCV
ncbi:MAG: 5'-3'-deoxyribonucleotidase [Neisseriaceae bacterium]|nr:5'-3'-deoxyribonucleotidase [Neisseriaceae bacterium]